MTLTEIGDFLLKLVPYALSGIALYMAAKKAPSEITSNSAKAAESFASASKTAADELSALRKDMDAQEDKNDKALAELKRCQASELEMLKAKYEADLAKLNADIKNLREELAKEIMTRRATEKWAERLVMQIKTLNVEKGLDIVPVPFNAAD